MSSRRGRSGAGSASAGMTLIEVLLALTILVMGLGAIFVGTTRCLSVIRQARNYETSRRLLARIAAESELDPEAEDGVEEGETGGEFADTPGFRWMQSVTRIGEPEDGLFEVVTRVEWSDDGRASQDTLTTWLYAPQSIQP